MLIKNSRNFLYNKVFKVKKINTLKIDSQKR